MLINDFLQSVMQPFNKQMLAVISWLQICMKTLHEYTIISKLGNYLQLSCRTIVDFVYYIRHAGIHFRLFVLHFVYWIWINLVIQYYEVRLSTLAHMIPRMFMCLRYSVRALVKRHHRMGSAQGNFTKSSFLVERRCIMRHLWLPTE